MPPKADAKGNNNPSRGGARTPDRQCSTGTAYFCLLGGGVGLHHIYLGRPFQAIAYACSPFFGGVCFLGVLRDLFRIPDYVEAANDSREMQTKLEADMKYSKSPPTSLARLLGMYIVGYTWAHVGWIAGPEDFPEVWFLAGRAIGGALGVWVVGMAGTHQTGSFFMTLAGSVLGLLLSKGAPSSMPASACGVIGFHLSRQWQPEALKPKLKGWKTMACILICWTIAIGGFLEHASITASVGGGEQKEYRLKHAIKHIMAGIQDEGFWQSFGGGGEGGGFNWESFSNLGDKLDVAGERKALRTLGMDDFVGKTYAAKDVKKAYLQMSKEWHPDKVGPDKKAEAETKMQEINNAKEVLDKIVK